MEDSPRDDSSIGLSQNNSWLLNRIISMLPFVEMYLCKELAHTLTPHLYPSGEVWAPCLLGKAGEHSLESSLWHYPVSAI